MNERSEKEPQSDDEGMIPGGNWAEVGKRVWTLSGEDNLSLIASGVAFNSFLAFIPFLTSVVLAYGLVAAPQQVATHISYLSDFLPQEAAEVVGRQLRNMVDTASSETGLGLLVTLGLALYGAIRGATGIITGLNVIFAVEESRSFLSQMGVAVAITIGLILSFMLASLGISVMNFLSALLPDIGGVLYDLLRVGFWVTAAAGVCVVISLIYRMAPNRGDLDWRWLTPGSVLATGTWLLATVAFGFYVRSFGNFQAVYGALGAVIIFLMWLYISAYILLLGAELNQVLSGKQRSGRRSD